MKQRGFRKKPLDKGYRPCYSPSMDTAKHPPIGTQALWHRSRQGLPPRPVPVVKPLTSRVRVLDLVEGDARRLIFRDVAPGNLTAVARG